MKKVVMQVCRISLAGGSQVGDINMWNRDDTRERLFTGKTRQIHSSHLTTYHRLDMKTTMATLTAMTLTVLQVVEQPAVPAAHGHHHRG